MRTGSAALSLPSPRNWICEFVNLQKAKRAPSGKEFIAFQQHVLHICQRNSIIFSFSEFSSFIAFTITKLEYFRRLARDASRKGALHQTIKEIHWRKLQQNTPTIGLEKNRWKIEPWKTEIKITGKKRIHIAQLTDHQKLAF